MDTQPWSLPNVEWSPTINSRFEVLRLADFNRREIPADHDPRQAHRINFHALILFTQGQGIHGVDFIDYPVKTGTLIHVCANQIHHFGHSEGLNGLMVVFLPAALPSNLLGMPTSISSFLSWSTMQYIWPSVTSIEPCQAQILKQHIELLEIHQTMKFIQPSQPAAQYLLWSVIAFAFQAAVESGKHHQGKLIDPRFLEFVDLLERSFEFCRNVKWYAAQINCTERTLYRICMATVGKSPKTITNERVAVEAQRRLLFSEATVKEVGYSLGFEETTNFIKFFRRLVGQNPDGFRMSLKSSATRKLKVKS
ncbi:AraC family transcriptional regulator [Okeania sp. SIO2B3]|uniref:helix-turn-helix domain-containing protein n=1 Tax=Okeania sp. SIO2B3 TaxID=2607784 RepID=UPI0013C1A3DF|nr:AraC family transcriptional regulator [Okeania sp. SIO2B3]NET41177.1 AraC family transcriptional regulator [Okeania sp. SIO2B3]